MSLTLRAMTPEDLPAVLEVERSSYQFPWSDGIFRDCLAAGYYMLLAIRHDRVVGFVVLLLAADEAHILNLCVIPSQRKKGVARSLLDAVLARAREEKSHKVFLEVRVSNKSAQRLYTLNGFNQIARRPDYYNSTDGREDALVFALNLAHAETAATAQ